MKLPVGDVLEWIAGAVAVVAVADGTGRSWPAWALAAVFVGYEAQCYGSKSVSFVAPKFTSVRDVYHRLMVREAAKRAARQL